MRRPSKLGYQISSGSVSARPLNSSSLKLVSFVGRRGRSVEHVQVAERRRRRDHGGEPPARSVRGVRHDVSRRDGAIDAPGGGIDRREHRVALLADANEDARPGRVPDRGRGMLAARRALIAADRAADVEVVAGGQVAGRAAGDVGDPEIGLIVGPFGLGVCRRDEGDALAVAGERVRPDGAVDVDDPPRLSAAARHGVEIAVAGIVVGLAAPVRDEVDVVAVGRPLVVAGAEFSARDLRGSRDRRRSPGAPTTQIVRRAIGIDVTGAGDAVRAVGRVGDHANVALRASALRRSRTSLSALSAPGNSSGRADDENAIALPSGAQAGAPAPRGMFGDGPRLAAVHAP